MTRTRQCERCQEEYEAYNVFVRDDFSEIVQSLSCEWDNLCKPCRMAVTEYGAYLTESEQEELTPKQSVERNGGETDA